MVAKESVERRCGAYSAHQEQDRADLTFKLVFVYTNTTTMIVWDEPKRHSNLERHRLDFADLDEWFFLDAVTVPAKDGRYMAIGRLNASTIAVVFAALGTQGLTVISMRPASLKERSLL